MSPTPLPSGTLVQGNVTETFTLTSGDVASQEQRRQDVILYRLPAPPAGTLPDGVMPSLAATFPITPSRTFALADLVQGVVHLDILAGREAVRGQVGGELATTVTSGAARVTVPGGAVPADTVITLAPTVLSAFLPVTDAVTPLAEVTLDLAGQTLASAAELSYGATGLSVAPTDALLLARVERIDGIPALVVVAQVAYRNERLVSLASPGLPGVTRGGRYVFVQVRTAIGWIQTTVTADGAPTPGTIVSTATGLPFIGVADTLGHTLVPATVGEHVVTGRVVRTALAGTTPVAVADGAITSATIALVGSVSTAVVTPVDGAIRVPVSAQVTIQSPVALSTDVVTAPLAVVRVSDGTIVPSRLQLSSTAQTLAVIPLQSLLAGVAYRLQAATLPDGRGGLVVVPMTTFTTQDEAALTIDASQITLSMPDAQGLVTISAPAGTLPAGASVLVVNTGSGMVLALTALGDGSLSGDLIASIQDRVLITITDPAGRATTVERSQYVAADGTTALSAAGGTVHGSGGVELRLPAFALSQAATFKLTGLTAAELPAGPAPDLPGLTIAGGLRIETVGVTRLHSEAKLAFPKPAEAPAGATYVVVRRLDGPEGAVAYETLDYATVQGTGAEAKVVTASDPFAGYVTNVGSVGAQGGASDAAMTSYAILLWAFDEASPERMGGVIYGRVLQTEWQPGAAEPVYVPVVGATVGASTAATCQPGPWGEGANLAVTSEGGTYALFDWRYADAPVLLATQTPGGTATCTTAYPVTPDLERYPGLRYAYRMGMATFVLPAVPPTDAPPELQIDVLAHVNGTLTDTRGLTSVGTPLRVRVRDVRTGAAPSTTPLADVDVILDGTPMKGLLQDDGTYLSEVDWIMNVAGAVHVTARAVSATGGIATASVTLRVVAAGGDIEASLPGVAPAVLAGQTVPKPGATGVPVTVYPQVVFTEPVTHVAGQVTLVEDGTNTPVPVTVFGSAIGGAVVAVGAETVVTSITLQPVVSLSHGTRYRLRIGGGMIDTDVDPVSGAPDPHALEAVYETTFTTFDPQAVGQTVDQFASPGVVVIDGRAFVAVPSASGLGNTELAVYDVADPAHPVRVAMPSTRSFVGTPVAIAGQRYSPVVDGPLVAIGTARSQTPWGPSNLLLFDVRNDEPAWVGAVSLGTSPTDGIIQQIKLRDRYAYVATAGLGKGVQVVDLPVARALLQGVLDVGETSPDYYELQARLNTESVGFGQQAIVQTIPIATGAGANAQVTALDVYDTTWDGQTQPLVIVTGRTPLAIVNPQTGAVLFNGPIPASGRPAISSWGYDIAAARLADRDAAVLLTRDTIGPRLVVVDLSEPDAPMVLGVVDLTDTSIGWKSRLLVRDGVAYIGGATATTVVHLTDPAHPVIATTIEGVGGQLALTSQGLLFGTSHPFATTTDAAGLQVAALTAWAMPGAGGEYPWDPAIRCTACPAPPTAAGRPVNVATGNVYFDQTDVSVAGIHGLTFTRSYNSHLAFQPGPVASPLGPGWTTSWDTRIVEIDDDTLMVLAPNGVPAYFRDESGSGRYLAFRPQGDPSVISRGLRPRLYVRTFPDLSQEHYDGEGRLTLAVDPVGQATTIARDGEGRITTVQDPGGRQLALEYDAATGRLTRLLAADTEIAQYAYTDGRLARVTYVDGTGYRFTTDARGQMLAVHDLTDQPIETHTYDAAGRGVTSAIAEDAVERLVFSYDDAAGLTRVTDPRGAVTTYHWRALQGVRQVVDIDVPGDGAGATTAGTWSWTAGRVTRQADALGAATSYAHDAQGNLTRVTPPHGPSVGMAYDVRGRVTRAEVAGGTTVTATYGPAGPVTVTQTAAGVPARTTQYTYTAAGQIQSVTDAAGQTSTYAYNAAGDLTGITDPLQHATTFAHDAFGRVTRTTDAAGRETQVTYDVRGRVLTVTAPGNQVTTYTYDTAGRRAGIVAPGGRTTTYGYDPYGRLATVSDAAGTTTYGYDLRSQVIALRDAKGQTTRNQYDLRGRLQQTLVEGDLAETYTYDALDRLATRTDRLGVTTTVAYDAAGRLARQTYSDGTPAVAYTYDALGRLTSAANGTATVTRTYTAAGELLTEASSVGGPEVRYTYDAAGRRASVALDASPLVTYGYDGASRLTTLQWAGRTVSLGYDATSLRTSLTYPNGIETTYAVNPAVQLTEVLAQRPATSSVLDRTGYTYDAFGQRESKTRPTGVEAYGYDPVGRLATIARDGVPAASYTYDAVGNRQTGPTPSDAWTTSPRNELLTRPGATARYDAAGRLIEQVRAGQTWHYAWNARSELVRVARDGLEVARFAYDPFGRRVRKVIAGVETHYTYDGDDILVEHRTQHGADLATWTYLHGPGIDEPLARHDATGTVVYYHADGLGSITTLTDDTGAVVATRTYDAWGNLESGAAEDGYAFTGREWEPAIGLSYYRARWYDPQAGRFLSEDPIGFAAGDPNLYAYTFGDPVNLTDPSGEIVPVLIAVGVAAYAVAEFALSVYDAYDTYRTLRDPNVSATMKVVAAGFFVAGALLPGGGYSKIDDAAECVVGAAKVTGGRAASAKQASSLSRHLGYAERYGKGGVKELENGRIRYYGEIQPANKAGEMAGARYVHEYDAATGRSRGWLETVDHVGNVRQVRPELNNGSKTHYRFDSNGKYTGSW